MSLMTKIVNKSTEKQYSNIQILAVGLATIGFSFLLGFGVSVVGINMLALGLVFCVFDSLVVLICHAFKKD
jgi:hypothetical protein